MKSILKTAACAAIMIVTFAACNKKDDPAPAAGKVKLEFANAVGGSNLNLNTQWYKNEHGDSFRVSRFNYYISNIRLNGPGGQSYTEAESYHLLEQEKPANMSFDMSNVPAGTYNSITFMIGVDSTRNVSGAQTGALDQNNGMFWSWQTGYIMLKFEGNSPKASTPDGKLLLHAGGFSGANSVLRTITLNLPNSIQVSSTAVPHVHLEANLLNLFKSPNVIDFSTMTTIHMPGADAKKLADNYANMFTVTYAGF